MGDTAIEWTDKTWNPVTGCSKVSQGCKNCYAERLFPRVYSGQSWDDPGTFNASRPRKFTDVQCHPERLEQPLHWRKPARIFVNSMSDLFHEDVPDDFIEEVFGVMALADRHTFQILTKRPERMAQFLADTDASLMRWAMIEGIAQRRYHERTGEDPSMWLAVHGPLLNVWLGVSVENQDTLHRIDTLKDIPAAVRFVSFEPLLEHLGALILDRIDWAILGSESGPQARDYSTTWFESIVRQCEEQHVSCFVKQLTVGGRKIPFEEWPGYLQVRQWPRTLGNYIHDSLA